MGNILTQKTTNAWAVLWAAVMANFLTGTLYVWSVISKGLITEYGWTSTQASLPLTLGTVFFTLGMMVSGRILDAKGPRVCLIISAFLMGGGMIMAGLTKDFMTIAISYGVVAGMGIGAGNIGATAPPLKWFPPEKKGLVTGIVVGGVGISPVVYSPLANSIIKSAGISGTFLAFGIGILVLMLVMSFFVKNPPAGYDPKVVLKGKSKSVAAASSVAGASIDSSKPVPTHPVIDKKPGEMLKTKEFYKLWLMMAFAASAGLMILGHAANIAKVQASWEGGFMLVMVLALFNAGGRLLGGVMSDKIGRIHTMRVVYLTQALNMICFRFYDAPGFLVLGVIVAGLSYGAILSVFPATMADFFGLKNMGSNVSLLYTGWGLGGVIGPMTAGAILDATTSYNMSYIVSCVLLLIALTISFTFKKDEAVFKKAIVNLKEY